MIKTEFSVNIHLMQRHAPVRQEIAEENPVVFVMLAWSYQNIFIWIFQGISSVLFKIILLLQLG